MIVVFAAILLIMVMAGLFSAKSFESNEKRKFDVDNVLLKLTVKQGESISKTLKITNIDSERADFKVNKEDLDFISISEGEFSLESGGVKTLGLDFDIENKSVGVYLGRILVSNGEALTIPVILGIETKEVLFDSNLNVPPEYSSVYPGEKAIIENQIFNLDKLGLKTVEVTYLVKDFKGKAIFSEQENIAVPDSGFLDTKIISIPEDAEIGDYVFVTILKYGDSIGTSSYFFKVVNKTFEIDDSFFMWIVIFLLFGLIFFIIYYVRQRDKMFLELERQYRAGLKEEVSKQEKEKRKIIKLKPVKRKVALKKFRKKRKKRLKVIKKIYKARVRILRKLKKAKKKNEMQRKLAQWKKEGYNVNEFLIKTGQKKGSVKSRVEKLKEKGYKI